MLYGWHILESELVCAVKGKAKDDAIIAFCDACRDFVSRHKGLYEAMQWYNMHQSEEHLRATEKIVTVLLNDSLDFTIRTILNGIAGLQGK